MCQIHKTFGCFENFLDLPEVSAAFSEAPVLSALTFEACPEEILSRLHVVHGLLHTKADCLNRRTLREAHSFFV